VSGSGKSVLAAQSVRDTEIAVHLFPGGVYWVKVGIYSILMYLIL
jgi:hypothetical protein